jgi:diphthamide synthase (EF-2-diphthine--ammonia ligase)
MKDFYRKSSQSGIDGVVFGDINLADLKAYRQKLLQPFHLEGIYPLWNLETHNMINDVINSGFKTLVCSADGKFFNADILGKTIDENFVKALPANVDPCGENGEFHTFVYSGPIFKHPIPF